jgi:methionyl aminopeptidase
VLHKSANPLRKIFPPSVISKVDPETGKHNPFPTYPFTGALRPVYPLSPKREVPNSIPHPDYAGDGIPKLGSRFVGRNNITILDKAGQEAMRKVCRLAREVLDIAAREVRPGITTDYLDEIVHKACLERNVRYNIGFLRLLANILVVISVASELQPFPEICLHIRERSHLSRDPRSACA